MNTNNNFSNSLFSNAIKQVKNSKNSFVIPTLSKSKLYSSNMDEDIDFVKESQIISESPGRMRSTISTRENEFVPYKKSISFVKKSNGTPNKIIINKRITKDNMLDKIVVKKDNSSWKHDLFEDESGSTNENYVVFVRNLPRYMTKSKLMDYFSKYGDIIGLNVITF